MDRSDRLQPRKRSGFSWAARILGLIFVGFWLFISVMMVVQEGIGKGVEDRIMAGLILCSTAAFIVAWWREGIGGVFLMVAGIAHSTFALFSAGHNVGLAMLISGGPFLLIGGLFLMGWSRSRANADESH
ncbi:MAG TPA: hypothetical protein G4O08_07240 [Anaerolineae bacterium]|nr:hypothetical protein [Anaerolineae bacterium]